MSEEIIKNQPGVSVPGAYNAEGGFASGGIGGVTTPTTGILGNIPTALSGVTSGANAVNPSGAAGSGILRPEQARQFIDYVWDATVLAKDGRRVTMRANTMELEKVNVGERVIRAAAQGSGAYTNAGATFSKVELTTKKIRLDWEVTSEGLEDNIEGAALEDHLVRLMTNAFGNDIEDMVQQDHSFLLWMALLTKLQQEAETVTHTIQFFQQLYPITGQPQLCKALLMQCHVSIVHLRTILSSMQVQMFSKASYVTTVLLQMLSLRLSQAVTVAHKQIVKTILMA